MNTVRNLYIFTRQSLQFGIQFAMTLKRLCWLWVSRYVAASILVFGFVALFGDFNQSHVVWPVFELLPVDGLWSLVWK